MRSWFTDNKQAVAQATIVFGLLYTLVLYLIIRYDFSEIETGGLLFIVTTVCCLLIAKNTFDEAQNARRTLSEVRDQTNPMDVPLPIETYTELYQNSPVPYLVIDKDGVIESANTAALRLFGLSKKKLLRQNIFELVSTDSTDRLDMIIEKYRSGVAFSDELVSIFRHDNQEAWALLSLFRFSSAPNTSSGLLTLVDITRQKKAEDAKSAFVSLASHQLRTPIAGMKWSVELLEIDKEAGELSAKQQKYVDRLLASINRMALLVDDFLRVSRFELGNFVPEAQAVSFSELCDDILAEQAPRAAQKSLKVIKQFDNSAVPIMSDPNLLRMILTNLVDNAIKYTRVNGDVGVRFMQEERTLRITVTDTGIGIPLSDQNQIFSKLFRASNALRDVPDGTGLGLYIVREAVSVLGGSISFTSTEGLGTTFEVLLPVIPAR